MDTMFTMQQDGSGFTMKPGAGKTGDLAADAFNLIAFDAYLFSIKSKHLSRAQLMGVGVYDVEPRLPYYPDDYEGPYYGNAETYHTHTEGTKTVERVYLWQDGGHYDQRCVGHPYLAAITTTVREGSVVHIYDAFLTWDYNYETDEQTLLGIKCGQHIIVHQPERAPLVPARRAPRQPTPIIEDDDDLPF